MINRPGYRNSHLGENISKKRKCLHPSCHVLKCGGRLLPSTDRVVGTSTIFILSKAAFTTISDANSIPVVRRFISLKAFFVKPLSPQWKSAIFM